MTKSSKLIATLGVVAGLGVAALPLGSVFAQETVSGNVDLYVEVPKAIAMTITGNNDTNPQEYSTTPATSTIDVFSGKDTSSTPITAGTVDGHTVSASTTVNSSSYAILTQNSFVDGSDSTTGQDFASHIKVFTNDPNGYGLSVKSDGTDANLVLTSGAQTYTINAIDDVDASTDGWSFKVAGNTGTEQAPHTNQGAVATGYDSYKAMTTTGQTIFSSAKATSGGDWMDVFYGVNTSTDQAAGVYHDTLIYTATTAN